jgi:2-methylcitrate dehydratase PrpD
MGKVVLEKNDRIEKNFPAEWPALVSIQLKSGVRFEKYVRYPKGDPENPLSWLELSAKFHALAARVVPTARAGQIVDAVREINSSTDLRSIWKLTARSRSLSLPAD